LSKQSGVLGSLDYRKRVWWLACACTASVSSAVNAGDFSYTIGYQAQFSDNIRLVPADSDDLVSDVQHSLFSDLVYTHVTRSVQERLHLGYEHQSYRRDDTYPDQNVVTVDAFGEWHFAPRLFSWTVMDTFRQVQMIATEPATPDNLENSNVLLTGPNLYLRFGALDRLTLEARYGNVYIANTELQNNRGIAAVRWDHRISTHTHIGADYEYTDVKFTGAIPQSAPPPPPPALPTEDFLARADYRRSDAFLSLGFGTVITSLEGEVGVTKIDRTRRGAPITVAPDFEPELEDDRVSVAWRYQLGRLSRFGARFAREFSDTGSSLLSNVDGDLIQSDTGQSGAALTDVVTGDIYYSRRGEAYFQQSGGVVPWGLRYLRRDLDFIDNEANNRQERFMSVDATYPLSSLVSVAGSLSRLYADYETGRSDRDTEMSVFGLYRLSREILSRLELRRVIRDSTQDNAQYTDNRVILTLTYRVGSAPARAPEDDVRPAE
jgi:hypothetical protein